MIGERKKLCSKKGIQERKLIVSDLYISFLFGQCFKKKLQGLFFPLGNKKIVHSYNNLLTKTDLISFKFFMDDSQYVADHGHSKWNEVDSRLREMLSLVDDWRFLMSHSNPERSEHCNPPES